LAGSEPHHRQAAIPPLDELDHLVISIVWSLIQSLTSNSMTE
jgi:hypothetical protein